MTLYMFAARASTVQPPSPYPIFWNPDYSAPGFAAAGPGGAVPEGSGTAY